MGLELGCLVDDRPHELLLHPGLVEGVQLLRARAGRPDRSVVVVLGSVHGRHQASMTAHPALDPEHDIFIQQSKLKNTLREWMGEQPVTHSEA